MLFVAWIRIAANIPASDELDTSSYLFGTTRRALRTAAGPRHLPPKTGRARAPTAPTVQLARSTSVVFPPSVLAPPPEA